MQSSDDYNPAIVHFGGGGYGGESGGGGGGAGGTNTQHLQVIYDCQSVLPGAYASCEVHTRNEMCEFGKAKLAFVKDIAIPTGAAKTTLSLMKLKNFVALGSDIFAAALANWARRQPCAGAQERHWRNQASLCLVAVFDL